MPEDCQFDAQTLWDTSLARAEFEAIRWPNGVVCPHCRSGQASWRVHQPFTPTKRGARAGLWKCAACRRQFTFSVGTVLESSKLSPELWLRGVSLVCEAPGGIRVAEMSASLGVSEGTARQILRKLLRARGQQPLASAWRKAITRRWQDRWNAPKSEVLAMERLRDHTARLSGTGALRLDRFHPVTLWPLCPREALRALLCVRRTNLL